MVPPGGFQVVWWLQEFGGDVGLTMTATRAGPLLQMDSPIH